LVVPLFPSLTVTSLIEIEALSSLLIVPVTGVVVPIV